MNRKTLTKILKTIFGAHHFVFSSKDTAGIAAVVKVSPERLQKLMRSPYWNEALHYWGYNPPIGDLMFAQQLWTELVENGEHINPVEYPDKPIKASSDNYDVYALIASHLFCVDNLSDADIHEHLAADSNPCPI